MSVVTFHILHRAPRVVTGVPFLSLKALPKDGALGYNRDTFPGLLISVVRLDVSHVAELRVLATRLPCQWHRCPPRTRLFLLR